MPTYYKSKTGVVRYVSAKLMSLGPDSVLTMIIKQEKSGGYSVITVIDVLSADIAPQLLSSEQPMSTSPPPIPDG